MTLWRPDPTFYPSPKQAIEAPAEKLAFVALLNPKHAGRPDAIGVVDVDPLSRAYGTLVGQVEMPNSGDELHHFGWNACSACLCPYASHPHTERRYLVVPGIRSSRIHIVDTKPDPRNPKIVKVIIAWFVYEKLGVALLRKAWLNMDLVWALALIATGGLTLLLPWLNG